MLASAVEVCECCGRYDNEHELEIICEKVVKLAKDLSLKFEMKEIEELLDQKAEELTNENLIALEEKVTEEERRVAVLKEV